MKISKDSHLNRDLIKLVCLFLTIVGTTLFFVYTPSLSSPAFLALVSATLIAPCVKILERRGLTKVAAVSTIFLILTLIVGFFSFWGVQYCISEWKSIQENAPAQFDRAIQTLKTFESSLKLRYPALQSIHPTDQILKWGLELGKWFVAHGPEIAGEFLTWLLIVPPFTFVLINDGPAIRKRFYQLVPNRFFESFFLITTDISTAISDYIRAKLVEGLLVGLMVGIGIAAIGAPYSLILGITAGITNIIPYLGPILGAIPAAIMLTSDPTHHSFAIPTLIIYLVANIVDTIVIFPLVVAKLVDLHPLILIFVVTVGQHYYGLIGMLISIPIATALKVILQEVYIAVYERHASRLNAIPLSIPLNARKPNKPAETP